MYDGNGRCETDRDEMKRLYEELKEYDPEGAVATMGKIRHLIGSDYLRGQLMIRAEINRILSDREIEG
jgi:hypothetical protein